LVIHSSIMPLKILIVSTPAGPIGSGLGGGLETTLLLLTRELDRRGHTVATLAPEGSVGLAGVTIQVPGRWAASVTRMDRPHVQTVSADGYLERSWEQAARLEDRYDAILNCSYDWISFYAAGLFRTPVLHWISVSSLVDSIDCMIAMRYAQQPAHFAFYSHAQADSFSFIRPGSARIIPGAVDLDRFPFVPEPELRLSPRLAWCARISPEKGLEDAIAAAQTLNVPLDVCGAIEDQAYWERLQPLAASPQTSPAVTHHGFLSHDALASLLGRSQAMLLTPKWTEAFGVAAIEAMACGTPVVAYSGGGPSEIIEHGVSGYLVAPGDISSLAEHASRAAGLDRKRVRARAEEYSAGAQASRIEHWVQETGAGDVPGKVP
jgi:UDP-glucose:tetrahydrobiopterin glucosyltransferase